MKRGDPMEKKLQEYYGQYLMDIQMNKLTQTFLELRHFKKGAYLMHAGDTLEFLLFLVNGKAKTLYLTHNGTNTLHSFLLPFSFIGDVEFFTDHTIINDVIALCDCDCCCISLAHRKDIIADKNLIYAMATHVSTKLIRSNHNKSVSLNYPVENRLAAYICATANNQIFQQNLQDGAEMIGCSYRQLQRILQSFVHAGYLIKIKKGMYQVTQRNVLDELGKDVYIF